MKLCPNCNKELLDNAKFCSGCGSKQEFAVPAASLDYSTGKTSSTTLLVRKLLLAAAIVIGIFIYYSSSKVNYDDLVGKAAVTAFQTKGLSDKLSSIGANADVRNFFGVANPAESLKRDGIYLVGSGCMPRNCGDSQGLLFVNTQTNDVVVITTTQTDKSFYHYGIDFDSKTRSFNKEIPPLARRWLKQKNIL